MLALHDSDPVSPGKPCAAIPATEIAAFMPKNAIEVRNLVKIYAGNRRTGPKQALKGCRWEQGISEAAGHVLVNLPSRRARRAKHEGKVAHPPDCSS